MVWGIASSDDDMDDVIAFRDGLGLTFPILWDPGGVVYESYEVLSRYPTAVFPKDWILDAQGTVVYVNNGYEPDEWAPILEAALSTD